MTQKIRIILAEDHQLFRKSLIALLKTKTEFDVVAEAENGRDLIEQLKQKETDIVLLDIEMPVMGGLAALDIIRKRFPFVKVIALSNHTETTLISDAMARGANCFLSKMCETETLFKAIREVKNEGCFFDNSISKALLDSILKEKAGPLRFSELSFNDRETDVLKGICDGKTNKEIASALHLSASTIDFYRSKIYSKTKCNNVAGLLKYALRNGIVGLG